MWAVFRNPQSIVCGLISGLLFIPTTIFDMVWGVRFLQEAHGMPYDMAVLRSAAVPFGWIIGCPLLGWISDRIGRRKPVIIGAAALLLAAMAWASYGPPGLFPPYTLGIARRHRIGRSDAPLYGDQGSQPAGARRHRYRRHQLHQFLPSALLGPLFAGRLMRISGGGERGLGDYQATFSRCSTVSASRSCLTLLLRETGTSARAKPTSVRAT